MSSKIISVILVLLVAASTVFGVMNFIQQNKISEKVDAIDVNLNGSEDSAQEDGVIIAGRYEIKSTKAISDAYISGDTSALDDREKETLDMAKKVIKTYITDDMSNFDKEYAIYKYLTTEMTFDGGVLDVIPTTDEGSDNPYGVLKNHTAICVGYATTMRMFMQMFGIDCMVVHSTDLGHSWDLVKLDGNWYHTDCYMDSETGNGTNFNMNDTICSENHSWNTDFFPAATSIKYNLAARNSKEIADIYAIPEFVSSELSDGEKIFSCTFKKAITDDDQVTAAYIADGVMNTINNTSESAYYQFTWSKTDDGNYILLVFGNDNSGGTDYDLPEDIQQKADDAITEFFPEYSPDGEYYFEDTEAKG